MSESRYFGFDETCYFLFGNRRRFRALDVVVFDDEDESPFVGMLRVEAAA